MTTPDRRRLDRRRLLLSSGVTLAGVGTGVILRSGHRGSAQDQSTPVATGRDALSDGLLVLLQRTPLMLPPEPFADRSVVFADLAAQIDAVGGAPTAATMNELTLAWIPVTRGLVLDDLSWSFSYPDEWREMFGWGFDQVDQYVALDSDHQRIFLLRGRYDLADLQTAHEASGSQQIPAPGGVAPDGAMIFGPSRYQPEAGTPVASSDLVKIVREGFETSAILPDGIVVYTESPDAMRRVLATAAGQEPALVDQPGLRELLDVGGKLASARLVPGPYLINQGYGLMDLREYPSTPGTPISRAEYDSSIATAQAESDRIDEEQRRMPEITHALLGITPGGPLLTPSPDNATPVPVTISGIPDAEFRFVLLFEHAEDATTAIGVIEDRLTSGQSYVYHLTWSELFSEWTVAVAPEDSRIVLVQIRPEGWRTNAWIPLYERNDLTFLGWQL